jgi:hypothetical protein
MRTFSISALVSIVLVAALAVPSTAQSPIQTTFVIDAQVVPNKAGTPKDPQGVKIKASARFDSPEGVEPPIVTRAEILFPRHGDWNGGRYPKCTERTLDRDGPERCPKESRIGFMRATAYADTIITRPKIEIFNGGQTLALAYVTLYRPALVQDAIPVRIKLLRSGKWKYRVSFRIPEVLQVVAGVPIAARSVKGWVGRGEIITSTSCPRSRRWPYQATAWFTVGEPYTYRDSVPCRPSGD